MSLSLLEKILLGVVLLLMVIVVVLGATRPEDSGCSERVTQSSSRQAVEGVETASFESHRESSC